MKSKLIPLFILLFYSFLSSQVGINNQKPSGVFHVDSAGNNPTDGTTPSETEQSDDFIISNTGIVSIGSITPSSYSSLEIKSTKGLRLPRLTADQISTLDAIASSNSTKKNGLTIYNTTTKCINYWALTEWIELCGTPICTSVSGTPVISPSNPNLVVNTATEFTVSGATNATGYIWKVNGTIQSETSSTFSYTPTSSNSVSITVTATGCDDSSTSESAAVTATPCNPVSNSNTPTITADSSLSTGTTTTFTTSEITNATSYVWYVDGTQVQSGTSLTYAYTPTSTTSVTISVVAKGCNDSSSSTASYTATSCTAVSGTPTISADSDLTVNSATVFTVSGVTNATSYVWYVNNTQTQSGTSLTYSYTPTSTASVTISVVAKGCNDSTSSTGSYTETPCAPVNSSTKPTITMTGSLKVNSTATFTTSSVTNATSYLWYVNNTQVQSGTSLTYSYTPTSTASVTISVVAKGCNDSSSSTGSYTGTPAADCTAMTGTLTLSRTAATANTGTTVKFTAGGVSNATRYVFTLNGTTVQDGASATYSYFVNAEQNSTIKVTAYDACGNTQTASTTLNSTTFTCKSVGRFLKAGTQCKTYYYCVTVATKYEYDCPNYPTSKFNQSQQKCTANVVSCPY